MSNLFKALSYQANGERKVIEIVAQKELLAQSGDQLPENEQDNLGDEAQQELLTHAEQQAAQIIEEANRMAEQVADHAREEFEALKRQTEADIAVWWDKQREELETLRKQTIEESRREGYQAGHQEGIEASLEAYRELLDGAKNLLEKAHEEKREIIASAEPFLVEVSVAIARKILAQELAADNAKVMGLVQEALARVRSRGAVTISANPEYYPVLLENRENLLNMLDSQSELIILPDHHMEGAGCLIETSMGSVDARIDTQLSEIKQALLQVSGGSESHEQTVSGKIHTSVE